MLTSSLCDSLKQKLKQPEMPTTDDGPPPLIGEEEPELDDSTRWVFGVNLKIPGTLCCLC